MTFGGCPHRTALNISTHTLTWSVTIDLDLANPKTIISTHTLTWSVTNAIVLAFL